MRKLILLYSVALLFCSSSLIFSQDKVGQTLTSEYISNPPADPRITEITSHISAARKSGDNNSQVYWESKLNELTHPQVITRTAEGFINKKENREIADPTQTLNYSKVSTDLIGSCSVSRERVNGNVYAAWGVFGSGVADTLKVARSTNNGVSFTLIASITAANLKIAFNGIDVEAVGKTDTSYAFISMSYTIGTTAPLVYSSIMLRYRQDGALGSVAFIGTAGANKYINARITSDNANYTTGTYVYMSYVLDSLVAGVRNLRSRLVIVKNPFAFTMTGTGSYVAATGNFGYYVSGAAPDTCKFETDLAFVESSAGVDQLYTVSIVRGAPSAFNSGQSLYITRSADYGAAAPTLFSIADNGYFKENPRIAAVGTQLNQSAMITSRRLFGALGTSDWDPYYFYVADITTGAPPVFVANYANTSADTTIGVSVCAKYGSAIGSYLFAYSNQGAGTYTVYARPFSAGAIGTNVQLNPAGVVGTGSYGYPDAAFRNVSSDSCLVLWGGLNGGPISTYGVNITGGCSGSFVGIGNNTTVLKDFRLDQNYPNPFNPTTNISYNIPVSGLVKIVVYDVLGSEVATVLNENKVAGYYSSVFDGKNLASGAYYYKITFTSDNNSFSQVKKMMLIK